MINVYTERLKTERENRNLIQKDIADILEIDRGQYSHYEIEYVTIPIKHLNTLCNYFEVSLDYIFNFTNTRQYPNIDKEIDKQKSSTRLKELRKINKISQTKLANYLNTSFTTISSYERGINIISTNYLYTICKKYNISADYLLGKIDSPKYIEYKK